eukprot:Nk52_evm5s372 gene=Nk52_evmTU5s372
MENLSSSGDMFMRNESPALRELPLQDGLSHRNNSFSVFDNPVDSRDLSQSNRTSLGASSIPVDKSKYSRIYSDNSVGHNLTKENPSSSFMEIDKKFSNHGGIPPPNELTLLSHSLQERDELEDELRARVLLVEEARVQEAKAHNKELGALKSTIIKLRARLEASEAGRYSVDFEAGQMRKEIENKENVLNETNRILEENDKMSSECIGLLRKKERQLKLMSEEKVKLQEEKKDLNRLNDSLKREIETEKKEHMADRKKLKARIGKLEGQIDVFNVADKKYQSVEKELNSKNETIEKLEGKIRDLHNEARELKRSLKTKESDLIQTEKKNMELSFVSSSKESSVASLQKVILEKEKLISDMQSKMCGYEKEIESLTLQISINEDKQKSTDFLLNKAQTFNFVSRFSTIFCESCKCLSSKSESYWDRVNTQLNILLEQNDANEFITSLHKAFEICSEQLKICVEDSGNLQEELEKLKKAESHFKKEEKKFLEDTGMTLSELKSVSNRVKEKGENMGCYIEGLERSVAALEDECSSLKHSKNQVAKDLNDARDVEVSKMFYLKNVCYDIVSHLNQMGLQQDPELCVACSDGAPPFSWDVFKPIFDYLKSFLLDHILSHNSKMDKMECALTEAREKALKAEEDCAAAVANSTFIESSWEAQKNELLHELSLVKNDSLSSSKFVEGVSKSLQSKIKYLTDELLEMRSETNSLKEEKNKQQKYISKIMTCFSKLMCFYRSSINQNESLVLQKAYLCSQVTCGEVLKEKVKGLASVIEEEFYHSAEEAQSRKRSLKSVCFAFVFCFRLKRHQLFGKKVLKCLSPSALEPKHILNLYSNLGEVGHADSRSVFYSCIDKAAFITHKLSSQSALWKFGNLQRPNKASENICILQKAFLDLTKSLKLSQKSVHSIQSESVSKFRGIEKEKKHLETELEKQKNTAASLSDRVKQLSSKLELFSKGVASGSGSVKEANYVKEIQDSLNHLKVKYERELNEKNECIDRLQRERSAVQEQIAAKENEFREDFKNSKEILVSKLKELQSAVTEQNEMKTKYIECKKELDLYQQLVRAQKVQLEEMSMKPSSESKKNKDEEIHRLTEIIENLTGDLNVVSEKYALLAGREQVQQNASPAWNPVDISNAQLGDLSLNMGSIFTPEVMTPEKRQSLLQTQSRQLGKDLSECLDFPPN